MDRGAIDIAVLSALGGVTQNLELSHEDRAGAYNLTGMNASQILDLQVHHASSTNDYMHKHIEISPRYRGFAELPTSLPSAAAEELTRCVNAYGFVGAKIDGADTSMTHLTGKIDYYDTEDFDVLWQKLEELDVPLFIYPRSSPETTQFYEHNPSWADHKWGFAESTAQLVIDLMQSGVFERFNRLKTILGHMGEILPFQAWRIKSGMPHTLRTNFHVTTSGCFDTLALQHVIGVMGVQRVLYATDYPENGDPEEAGTWFKQAVKKLGLNETEKEIIEFRNAETLIRIRRT